MIAKINVLKSPDTYLTTNNALRGGEQKKHLFCLLYTLYSILTLVRYVWPENLLLSGAICFLGLLSLILLSTKIPRENWIVYFFIGLLAVTYIISSLSNLRLYRMGNELLFIFFNFGIALILLGKHVYSYGAYLVFYVLAFFMFFLILIGADPNEVLKVVSRNGISEMMIYACVSLYIIQTNEEKKIDLKPAFFTLLISIWAVGPSGIIASFVLFIGLLLIRVSYGKSFICFILFILLTIFLMYGELLFFSVDNPFFGQAISHYLERNLADGSDPRFAIWVNYFNNLDAFRVFFGVNPLTDPWSDGALYAYNYHNMFIQLHQKTGLMAILICLILLFALHNLWGTNKVFFVLLFAICLRGMTDSFMFFESWDYILYFFIFYFLRNSFLIIKSDNRVAESGCKFISRQT